LDAKVLVVVDAGVGDVRIIVVALIGPIMTQ